MKKPLYIILPMLGLLFLANHVQAGIIIRPVLNTGLIGYWDFNEGAGDYAYDKSGKMNHGTLTGAMTQDDWVDGKMGKALDLDGSNDYINVADDVVLNTDSVTVSAWVYVKDWTISSSVRQIVQYIYPDATPSGYYLALITGNGFAFGVNEENWGEHRASLTGYSTDTWYHVVGVYDNANSKILLYVNGSSSNETSLAGPISYADFPTNMQFQIGRDFSGGATRFFAGVVDEIRVYNRALSESEIERLYKLSSPKIGVNQLGLVDPQLPANATISYVREDCTGYSPCYNTLNAWEAAFGGIGWDGCTTGDLTCLSKTLVAIIDGTWNSPDTTATTITGWTTNASNYIHIYTTASARHPGKWDETKYRLQVSDVDALVIQEEYVRIDGLQIKIISNSANEDAIRANAADPCDIRISNNILVGSYGGSASMGFGIAGSWYASGERVLLAWNNIIYDFVTCGIYAWSGWRTNMYNNTIYNSASGIDSDGAAFCIAKNNLIYNNTDNYAGNCDLNYSTNNLSGPGADTTINSWPSSRNGVQVNFVDAVNDDFHLSPGDGGARNYGTDLSGSGASVSFSTDIDRKTRDAKWDIGADEAAGTVVGASQANQITNGLVGYWPFNGPDIDGNTAYDRSSQGNNGAITGATPIDGKVGQALSFNGTSDYVTITDPGASSIVDFSTGSWIGISAWFKYTGAYAANKTILGKHYNYLLETFNCNGNNRDIGLVMYDDGYSEHAFTSCNDEVTLNQWMHIAVTYKYSTSGSAKLYINGALVSGATWTGTQTFTPLTNNDPLRIGDELDNHYFPGIIDEVRLYNRELTAEDVLRLYNLGR